jgi:pimeloyl-ACP methyl ester carboxylesterase
MSDFPDPHRVSLPARKGHLGDVIAPIDLAVYEKGSGPAVIMSHGFPELAYSWRHQLAALADAGFRAIAIDQRGYGESDCPPRVEDYDIDHLTSDVAGVLDALGIEKAVVAGHDWGGFVAWAMPVLYPDRILGAIGVNTPNFPFPTTAFYRTGFKNDDDLYILWFQTPGVAEEFMDVRPGIMRRAVPPAEALAKAGAEGVAGNPFLRIEAMSPIGPELLTSDELEYYVRAFTKTGFRGGINWYRNIDGNAERFPAVGTTKLDIPCLMITAEWDPALPPSTAAGMPDICTDLEMHMIAECGHWTQQEKPDELSHLMVDWLKRRF